MNLSWTPSTTSIPYGTNLSGVLPATASCTGCGTFAYTASGVGTVTSNTILGVAGSPYTLTATFTLTDTTHYNPLSNSHVTANLTVTKATTTISTLPSASAITYGQTLASSTLTGGSVVSGSNPVTGHWAFTTPTTVPAAGTDSESVTFTPDDTNDYEPVSGSVNVVVNKATPTITWNAPASIVYGTALSATQLNASSTVNGNYAYTPVAGTILSAGAGQTLSVTFTPNDTVDYTTATATTTIDVTQATLTITVNSTSRAYGAPNPTFTGTVIGLQNGDTVTTTYSTTATVTSDVGPWPITAAISGAKAANYTASVTAGTLTITKAPLTIVVNSATRVYDTANPTFTGTITGLLNGDTVTPAYTTTATLTSPAGTYPITATISGAKAGDYNPTITAGTLTITQANTSVTWAAPAAIIYGTPLSATQLNASASVGGSFAYTPAAGTILPVGAGQVLSVTFTPTDSTDYKPSTGTTTISVGSTGLTVIAKNASRVYGAANPTFTGTITGAQGGDTFTESFTTSATTASAVGTYPIVPSASGPNLGNYTVVIDNGILTIAKANTTTGLSASGSSVNPGSSVTLTATVASTTSGTPTGTVSFYDGTTLLGTGTLSGGVATYSTSTLAAGSSNTHDRRLFRRQQLHWQQHQYLYGHHRGRARLHPRRAHSVHAVGQVRRVLPVLLQRQPSLRQLCGPGELHGHRTSHRSRSHLLALHDSCQWRSPRRSTCPSPPLRRARLSSVRPPRDAGSSRSRWPSSCSLSPARRECGVKDGGSAVWPACCSCCWPASAPPQPSPAAAPTAAWAAQLNTPSPSPPPVAPFSTPRR